MTHSGTIIIWISGLIAWGSAQALTIEHYSEALAPGYHYLDPLPESEYVAPETRLLIRFAHEIPGDLTNLSTFVQVEGEFSGPTDGLTTIASGLSGLAEVLGV